MASSTAGAVRQDLKFHAVADTDIEVSLEAIHLFSSKLARHLKSPPSSRAARWQWPHPEFKGR